MADKKIISVGAKSKLVEFTHPQMDTLRIYTGLTDVEWGYTLNTATFPTYGGEVVQILSASVDSLNVGGDIHTYNDMLDIYSYFFKYFQIASQGRTGGSAAGISSYNQEPMTMTYPERNWTFQIQPMGAPAFHVGKEVVVPSWKMSAFVVHFTGANLTDEIKSAAAKSTLTGFDSDTNSGPAGISQSFFDLSQGVGYVEASPFSDPFSSSDGINNSDPDSASKDYIASNAAYYQQLLSQYGQGDFQSLLYGFESGPAGSTGSGTSSIDLLNQAVKGSNG